MSRTHTKTSSQRKTNDWFLHVTAGLAGDTGESFFQGVCKGLARALAVDFVFVGRYHHRTRQASVESVAVLGDGRRASPSTPGL